MLRVIVLRFHMFGINNFHFISRGTWHPGLLMPETHPATLGQIWPIFNYLGQPAGENPPKLGSNFLNCDGTGRGIGKIPKVLESTHQDLQV